MNTDDWPELLTVVEVAAILRVSKMTVYRLVSSGELTAMQATRIVRIHADSVRKLLRA